MLEPGNSFKKESSFYSHCLLVISRQVHLPRSKIEVRPTVRN
jgi:hypothetical protein